MKRFILDPKHWLWPVAIWAVTAALSLAWNWREVEHHKHLAVTHGAAWLLLSALTVFFLWRLREQMSMLDKAKEQHISELKQQVTEKEQAEAQLRQLINSSGGGIYGVDAVGSCTFCNPAALRLLGYQDLGEVLGKNMHDLIHASCREEGRQPLCRLNAYRDGIATHVEEDMFWRADGSSVPVEFRSHPIFSEGKVIGAVVTFSDITVRMEAQKDLWSKANFDELTTLPNRNLFYDRLEQAIAQARRSDTQVALLYIDLDGFKAVNERFGHDAGDELLRSAAERLVESVRDSDTVARMGGDEFTIVLSQVAATEEVKVVAAKALEQLSQPFMVENREIRLSSSIGIALYPRDGGNGITLIKHADLAMYRAKESGCNAYRFFSDGDD